MILALLLAGETLDLVFIKGSLFGFTSGGLLRDEGSALALIVFGSLISSSIILGDKSELVCFLSMGFFDIDFILTVFESLSEVFFATNG